jgi:hypothetical protein
VQRPRAKEGGREEEEKRSGISVGSSDRLHSNKHITFTGLARSRDPVLTYANATIADAQLHM